jgi:TRAP-type C4-dicarboxylate transport system permease small subunit
MIGRAVTDLARLSALAGGAVLIVLVVMTAVSVTGRALVFAGLGPVSGDFELVEAGIAFAIFAFLPWCHLTGGHASVDFLADRLGTAGRRIIQIVADGLMLVAALLIAWRLAIGTLDKKADQETTFILQIPLWWAYSAALAGAVVFVVVAAYCFWLSLSGKGRPAA